MKKSIVLLATMSIFAGHLAFANKEAGNGGGAWVCRESSGEIRWSKLVDLFEATDEFGLKINEYSGSTGGIVQEVQSRVFRSNRDLHEKVSPFIANLNLLQSNPPVITYTENTLQVIDDSLYRMKPSPKRCSGGNLAYEQIANFKEDGLLLIQSEIFNSLTAGEKAALVYHEGIYKYRRDQFGDTNSVITRRLVGLIFSTLSDLELKQELLKLGEREVLETEMKFGPIRPGSFLMGSPSSEVGRSISRDEQQHAVTLTHPFEMQITHVTQAQWVRVMGTNPSFFQSRRDCLSTYKEVQGIGMCPNNPVENVSFEDAQQFIAALNAARADGYSYRLPTEAEWEYAARAGTTTAYFFGDDSSQLGKYAWFISGSGSGMPDTLYTRSVALLKPNGFGLYDVYGNVSVWVSDWYAPYDAASVVDPAGPSDGRSRVVRGGFYGNEENALRSASRDFKRPSGRSSGIGFRLVRQSRVGE